MSKLRGWLCASDKVRNHQNQLIRAAVFDEVRMRNTEDAQFQSLLELGIKKYIWDIVYGPTENPPNPLFPETSTTPVEIQVSTSRHEEENPEPTTPSPHHDIYLDPVTGMFPDSPRVLARNEEMTQVAIRQTALYPPQPQPEPVDPSTLTPSDDEEPLPVLPPYQPREDSEARERRERSVSRSLRRGRRPEVLFHAGLAYVQPYVVIPDYLGHLNRGGVPRGARVISSVAPPPFQNDYTDQPIPNSRRSQRTICFKCNQPGHAKIHCAEYQCRYCRRQAPGHRPSHCNAGPREDSSSHDTNWRDDNHDDAANHNIDT